MSKTKHLIDYFIPKNYSLDIATDTDKMLFHGSVSIKGTPGSSYKDDFYFHYADLEITSISLNGKKVDFSLNEKAEEIRVSGTKLHVSNNIVDIVFNGKISTGMTGIYQCPYIEDGKEKVVIGTQFESHYARRAFPCVDEPLAKATFDITLHTPKGETVLSNTDIKKQSKTKNGVTTIFEKTPIMSTYLVAFAHGEVSSLESKTKRGTIVRTWATTDNVPFTKHSLEVAVKTLEFLEDYFAIPYPLDTCDMIGLPNFSAGAMENWGLITFREASLFVDPANTTQPSLEHVTMTVVHELVHQWFGNLVTMKWWNDLWLNEGFASFMPYLVMDELYPEWNVWTQFLLDDFIGAQALDALMYSHPIEVTIDDPDEIRTIFDSISYDKGASILNMLHTYLGAEDFRDGLRLYLDTHKYKNTTTKDLWDSLETVSGKPVAKFMKAWTSQTGYPVVHIVQEPQQQTIKLSQERFMINARERSKAKDKTIWPIPISMVGNNDMYELKKPKDKWPNLASTAFNQKFNAHNDSFYMTAYETDHLQHVAKQVASGSLAVRDRIGLLQDTFSLAKAGYIETTDALELLKSYNNELNPFVWDIIAGSLGSIKLVMDSDELRDLMKPYIRALVNEQAQRLGWEALETETYYDTILRPTILALAVGADHPDIKKEAIQHFRNMKNPEDAEPNIRGVIYQAVALESHERDYKKMQDFYKNTQSPQEKVKLAAALCSFKEKEQYTNNLKMIQSEFVKSQDIPYWIAYSFINRHARVEAWSWFKKEWKSLQELFASDVALLAYLPRYAGRVFSSDEFEKEFTDFFKDNTPNGVGRQISQTIETIQWQADWKKRDHKTVLAFFQSNSSIKSTTE